MNQKNQSQHKDQQQSQQAAYPLDRYTVQQQSPGGEKKDDSPYYQSQAPSISLPKGGGALKGIDEKFSVNAVNGTAGLQVALPLTPGRSGFTPALSLSYNSGSGNSEFGLGWGLSLPAIQRKTDKKLPLYNDAEESDVFLLAGAEDLVPELEDGEPVVYTAEGVTRTYTIKRYRPRIEGLFARIEYIQADDSIGGWWKVTTKDNLTTFYGLTGEGRISDPDNAARIFKWLPQVVTDHKGNLQEYTYKQEDFMNVPGALHERNRLNSLSLCTNRYLSSVAYCNTAPRIYEDIPDDVYAPSLPSAESGFDPQYMMRAVLDYGEYAASNDPLNETPGAWSCRKDPFSDFHAGFEIRTWRLCRRVLMFHYFNELRSGDPCLIRSLDMVYVNDEATGFTETDYIHSFTQTGHVYQGGVDPYSTRSLPPMVMNYEPLNWNTAMQEVTPEYAANAPQGLTGNYQWIDLYGEGLSGILTEQANGWFYKQNLGDGQFTPAQAIAPKPSLQGLGNGLQWQDLDADGRRQLVSNDPSLPGYYELDDDQQWAPFRHFRSRANVNWNSPFTRMLDLDGDGRADLLITEDRVWTWYANKGTEGFVQGGENSLVYDEEKGPRLLLNDEVQSVFLADMNGDGMTDIVRIKNGEICYWPNKGYGDFGAKITMSNAPLFDQPDQFHPQYITLADISGTGAADILYLGNNQCTAWINLSGNAWSEAYTINPLPSVEPYSKIVVMDFLGNGTGCIVWSSPLPQHAHAPMRYIDLMGGKKPHLLTSYQNGFGKTTTLHYKSATKFYLQDQQAGTPWVTRLPFPVHCISSVTTEDSVSDTSYTQCYRYHHGYYDHEEREFRGFGMVEVKDIEEAVFSSTEELDQPPVLTRTWYHTGAWMRESTLADAFAREYASLDTLPQLAQQVTMHNAVTPQEQREAYRALKGSPLRQEVYALDGSPREDSPYTVTAYAYDTTMLQAAGNNRYAIFLTHQQQAVSYHLERQSGPFDPRISQELTLSIDTYGNPLETVSVVYPRQVAGSTGIDEVDDAQALLHLVYHVNTYTDAIITEALHYRTPMPATADAWEIGGVSVPSGLFTLQGLIDLLDPVPGPLPEIDFSEDFTTGVEKRLLSKARTLYQDNTATGAALPLGEAASLGLPYQQYQLALTEDTLSYCYGSDVTGTMLTDGGYQDLDSDGSWWIPSGTVAYPVSPETHFYLPEKFADPWSNETTITYDSYHLLPLSVADALGNTSTVEAYDWRCLQPVRMKDINDNYADICYDALCMPVAIALKGKDAPDTEADALKTLADAALNPEDTATQASFWTDPLTYAAELLGQATWRCVYDLDTAPNAVAMIAREKHYTQDDSSPVLIRFTYTDGFGRVAMHKVQAQPDAATPTMPRWIASGKTVYNNKGKAVMQFEPYFDSSHAYDHAADAVGVSPKMYYDPLGRLFKTLMPDKSFNETEWTPWIQTTYDANDTVLDSDWYYDRIALTSGEEYNAAVKAAAHADTPTTVHLDTLAQPFYTLQMPDTSTTYESYVVLDVQGNRLAIHDALGRTQLQYRYNLVKVPCHTESMDSGIQLALTDVAGQPLYAQDADGREFSFEYDELRRPTVKKVDGVVFEQMMYGESLGTTDNMRGQLYQHYDGGGMQQVNGYDFKGNPLSTQQQLLADATITDVDWESDTPDDEVFIASIVYDALNRPLQITDPGLNITAHTYNQTGMLQTVLMNSDTYVQDIHYDAKGQRTKIWYGNGTKTCYEYDELTFRLRGLKTRRLSDSVLLQDLHYYYDPVGNITSITDGAQQDIFYSNTIVTADQSFTYDALYRLTAATGREQSGTSSFGSSDNYTDSPWMDTLGSDASQTYTQGYLYDAVGNITELQHSAATGSYTRSYDYITGTNRLSQTVVGSDTYTCTYDTRGNMVTMPHLDVMDWNTQNQFSHLERGTTEAWYQYSGGQRIRKWVDKGGGLIEERTYLGSWERYRKYVSGTIDVERSTVHISDDTGRIAMVEIRNTDYSTDGADDVLIRYIYSNHLQSASLELNQEGSIISYEEYHPYGTTAWQARSSSINATAKRYRYTGKERDEETGLYYHGARYYIPWLCRWSAVDPLESKYAGWSGYNYGFDNPVIFNDPSGMAGQDTVNYANTINVHGPAGWRDNDGNIQYGIAGGTLEEGSVIASRPASIGIPTLGAAADNTSIFTLDANTLEQVKTAQHEREVYDNEQVLDYDGISKGYIGSRKDVARRIFYNRLEYSNQVGEAIAGGPFGAAGYHIAGDKGAFAGSSLDGITMSLSDPGTAYGRTELITPVTEKEIATTETFNVPSAPKKAEAKIDLDANPQVGSLEQKVVSSAEQTAAKGAGNLAIRSDIVLSGGRSGQLVKTLTGPANSVVKGGQGRIFITDKAGKVIWDVTKDRAKSVIPGQGFGPKVAPTQEQLNLLNQIWK